MSHLGEIRCKRCANNAVEHLRVSWKSPQARSLFCCGGKWKYSDTCIVKLCDILTVKNAYVKSVLRHGVQLVLSYFPLAISWVLNTCRYLAETSYSRSSMRLFPLNFNSNVFLSILVLSILVTLPDHCGHVCSDVINKFSKIPWSLLGFCLSGSIFWR